MFWGQMVNPFSYPTSMTTDSLCAAPIGTPTLLKVREHLSIYRQSLVAGLWGASRRPTNLAKVRKVVKGPSEFLLCFLERLVDRRYILFDPQAEEQKTSVVMAFIR